MVRELLSDQTGEKAHEIAVQIEELERQIPIRGRPMPSENDRDEMGEWTAWNTLVTLGGYPFELRGHCRRAHLATTLGRLVICLRDLGADPDLEGSGPTP